MKLDSLRRARETKNDEFYTRLEYIESEVWHYKEEFKGKVVYCNCDDPEHSKFWLYFKSNYELLGLKGLIVTHYEPSGSSYRLEMWNNKEVNRVELKQNGDFRSVECLELLNHCDIVVTNPPFSLFREYMEVVLHSNKQFLVVGSSLGLTYKSIYPKFSSGLVHLGFENGSMVFDLIDGAQAKMGNIAWYTNLKTRYVGCTMKLTKTYNAKDYPFYDNYDAIDVNRVVNIPSNYTGKMGVPASFLNKYSPEQFEVLGFCRQLSGYIKEDFLEDYFAQGGKGHYTCGMRVLCFYDVNGVAKFPFSRVIIRRVEKKGVCT